LSKSDINLAKNIYHESQKLNIINPDIDFYFINIMLKSTKDDNQQIGIDVANKAIKTYPTIGKFP